MTRQKKKRSAGSNGLRHLPADEARKQRAPKEQTKKKGSGLKSGNRNSQLEANKAVQQDTAPQNSDPRHGSKKPVELQPSAANKKEQSLPPVTIPKASLVKAREAALSPEQELAQIESDAYLQQLLERVENDEILKGKDAKYFNAKTARLELLLKQLGLDSEEENTTAEQDDDPLATFERTDWRKSLLGNDD